MVLFNWFPLGNTGNDYGYPAACQRAKVRFSEIHLAIPYEGTNLQNCPGFGDINGNSRWTRLFLQSCHWYASRNQDELIEMRKKTLRSLYLSPRYINNTLIHIRSLKEVKNYTRYGARLLKNLLKH